LKKNFFCYPFIIKRPKKNSNYRLISLAVVAAVISIAFASCSKKNDPEPIKSLATSVTLEVNPSKPSINFITWNEDYLHAMREKIPAFEKENGIEVTWRLLSEDVVREKVLIDLASGAGEYDLVLTDVWILPEHVHFGYLEPLDEFAKSDPAFKKDFWYPEFLDALTYEDHLYALPTESFGAAMMIRKDLLEKKGISIPKTTDELEAAARMLTLDLSGDGKIDLFGAVSRGKAGEEPTIVVSGFAWAYGGSWFEGGASTASEIRTKQAKPSFNSPEFIAGFKKYCDLLRKFGPPGIKDYSWYEIIEHGKKGTAAIILNSDFNVGALDRPSIGMREKYIAALPVKGPARYTQEAFAMGYGINKHSRNKKAAWQFLKFLTGTDFMEDVVKNHATSIAIRSLREGDLYREMHPYKTDDDKFVLEESIRLIDWDYMPKIPEYSVISNMLGTATSEVIAGKKNPKEAMDHLNNSVFKLMKQSGYYN